MIEKFIKKEPVFCIALILAIVSCIFVPVDYEYLFYFDIKTLSSLFIMMGIICGIVKSNIMDYASNIMISKLSNTRNVGFALVFITFIASIFIANDMALLAFLPLCVITLVKTQKTQFAIYFFILQNIAANMGGMLTPFGNPQNLYLYNYYGISNNEFFSIMVPLFLTAIVLLFFGCLLIKKQHVKICEQYNNNLDIKGLWFYGVMFFLGVFAILKILPYYPTIILIFILLLIKDYKNLKNIDYFLLLTFCCFFVLSKNIARIEIIQKFISNILIGKELIVTLGLGQFISNVPSALLVSAFSDNYLPILIAVNIGALGSLVSSLASLIAFNIYSRNFKNNRLKYLVMFTIINLIFLIFMIIIAYAFIL